MEHRTLTDRIASPVTAVVLSATLLVALFMLVETALQNVSSGQVYYWVLVVNIVGIVLLLLLLILNIVRLAQQYRAKIPRVTSHRTAYYHLCAVDPDTLALGLLHICSIPEQGGRQLVRRPGRAGSR